VPYGFLDIAATPSVRAAQVANGGDDLWSETGWPYVQHRGGPPGFLRVIDDKTLAFADFRGNRQYISLGNVAADDRACLILMDYPRRARLKIFAHVEVRALGADPEFGAALATPGYRGKAERAFVLHLEAFDWNCQQHITPRFTMAELAPTFADVRGRIAALEAENAALRERLGVTEAAS
jgi:predicted pyridoxine 5'-phosphate oxidase superfamily flavin-nucleotide-binding protein